MSGGDKVGLLLDLDGGTLEVHHNGENLGAIRILDGLALAFR